tara:strand:- start:605 stop:1186 length:582 start_codon:yes stop_codon:yes gene_type:complete
MSTRSRIGILYQDGTVESVYCHQDGYPEYTGYFLENFYTTTKLVEILLSKGDISNIATSYGWDLKKQTFNDKELLSLKTYAQRGEKCFSVIHDDVMDYLKYDSCDEYKYLFSNGEKKYLDCFHWLCFDMSKFRKIQNINEKSIVRINDIFTDIPKKSRYFNFNKQVINPTDFLHLEQQDTVESIGAKIMQMGL